MKLKFSGDVLSSSYLIRAGYQMDSMLAKCLKSEIILSAIDRIFNMSGIENLHEIKVLYCRFKNISTFISKRRRRVKL